MGMRYYFGQDGGLPPELKLDFKLEKDGVD